MDIINIKNLEVHAKHGVLPAEKKYRQKFLISAALFLDSRKAGVSDCLDETVDYAKITVEIKEFVENNTFNLIETVASRLAEKLLLENSKLQKVKIDVSKPEARINADFETVSVEVLRSRHIAYLSLGSNIGDREANLNFALREIEKRHDLKVLNVSEFINTAPYGVTEQDDFLNACATIETLLAPHELLAVLQEIEIRAGRERLEKWGPRTLDIDIVYFDDIILSDDELVVPHIDMHNRQFVLAPLCEIAPNKRHPILMKTTTQLLEELTDSAGES